MKIPEMKTGLTISTAAHAGLLLWGLVSFSARPLEAAQPAMPIDIVSDTEFSKLAAGIKNAPLAEMSQPLVEKVGENKPAEEPVKQVSEKPEIKPQSAPQEQAKAEKKTDEIAEALKRDETKRKREEARAKAAEQKKLKEQQQPKFDPTQIAALLDKRDPQRQVATGETLAQTPSLGFTNAQPAQLSQSELDALRRRLGECWSPPVGAANAPNLKVVIRVLFKRDGSVAAPPALVAGSPSPYGPAMAESATRAILSCQPFTMLKPQNYEQWKDIEITFDPRDMFRT